MSQKHKKISRRLPCSRCLVKLLGILISLIAASESESRAKGKSKSETRETEVKSSKKLTESAKSIGGGENRGKRTLYDFENAGYLYSDIASRRAGYVSEPETFYTQNGYYNGQDAIAQFPSQFGSGYSQYPQYLEAPEPIIEIIIKDSNETLPAAVPQPVITKKKKEKVHVFYVNYKKDKNNKLHLETPIASLNNNDENENEEEEEEIAHYSVASTPAPPLKTTTLRTIIHPDSEQYHSNSGIHVTFGTSDKAQSGHLLEEHNAESLQHSVVALPLRSGANTRADYLSFNQGTGNSLFNGPFQQPSTPAGANNFYQTQQLPALHSNNFFRSPQSTFQQQNYQMHTPSTYQKPQVQQQQQNQQQHHHHHQQQVQAQNQRPNHNHAPAASSTLSKLPFLQELQQQAKYYVQSSQQYQQHSSPTQQQHKNQQQKQAQQQTKSEQNSYYNGFAQKPEPVKQPLVFPGAPPKQQELPSRQPPQPYQPVKFRPTPTPIAPLKPVAAKLDNTNYQHFNQQPTVQQQLPQQQKPLQFNRQPQYVQQPTFTLPALPVHTDYYKSHPNQHATNQAQRQNPAFNLQSGGSQYFDQKPQHNNYQSQSQTQTSQKSQAQQELNQLHKYFEAQPSRETELLKSIPKYEQHITETLQSSPQNNYHQFVHNGNTQVIHDVPAPNLGTLAPTAQVPHPAVHVKYNGAPTTNTPLTGHFITASSLSTQQQRLNNAYATSTATPQYAHTNDGQKVMIVTPMPAIAYNQYAQQPRQSANSVTSSATATSSSDNGQFSVSTYHADVFKQLEKLQQQNNERNEYVRAPGSTERSNSAAPAAANATKATQTLLQLPEEVPDDLREQLLSSGILNNADISVLDYDKVGGINIENLPPEHLKHFYGSGGGAQLSESNKVVSVLKPNGENVSLSAKDIERVKLSHSLPQKQNLNVKVVHFDKKHEEIVTNEYLKANATLLPAVQLAEQRQYNRYLPLKINGAHFPLPESEELRGKKLVSVVVLAPVDSKSSDVSGETRLERDTASDTKEVKFLGGDLIKTLVKKPTKENFKRWLEKEARTDVELQSIVLLVARASEHAEQEIFMYDIGSGVVNKLNGDLSNAFVSVAEENASAEDLEHASTLDHSVLENMMHKRRR